jgi:hypothetical protein
MKLELKRRFLGETYTIGDLYINGKFFSNTLEDKVRDLNKDGDLKDVGEGKIMHETAIPYGTYSVIMNMSNRFKRIMPLLLDVPHFAGIRIHSGNKASHSSGCILVGINSVKGGLTESKKYEKILYDYLLKEKVSTITIS